MVRSKMYAPATYEPGSSYSHFDESTYPAGDPASLMTPSIGYGEAIHDPGALGLGLLNDIGWTAGYPVAEGCTDPASCNYEPTATIDDGSCLGAAIQYDIYLTTDNYPTETSWTISDNVTGEVVASGGGYDLANNAYWETGTLCPGCYVFTISDVYGDGICCAFGEGNYALYLDSELYASGGAFGFSEETGLCDGPCVDSDLNGLCDEAGGGDCLGQPFIASVFPMDLLSCVGGDLITLTGNDLCDAEVLVNGVVVPTVVNDPTLIEFFMPAGSGFATIEVNTIQGPSNFVEVNYAPPGVVSWEPSAGIPCDGGVVTVYGSELCSAEVWVDGMTQPVLSNDATFIRIRDAARNGGGCAGRHLHALRRCVHQRILRRAHHQFDRAGCRLELQWRRNHRVAGDRPLRRHGAGGWDVHRPDPQYVKRSGVRESSGRRGS